MKHTFLILIIVFSSCAAPISYVNNIPRSSGLEEEGDVRLNVNIGSDTRGRDKVIQVGAAWSPIENFGLDIEYSGHLKIDDSNQSLDNVNFLNGSLIYYHTLSSGSSLEFKLSAGTGRVNGQIDDNHVPILNTESILIDTQYRTYSAQANYNFLIPNESTRASVGFRARKIDFDNYTYIRIVNDNSDQSFETENWDVYVLDPFIEVNQEINENLNFNSRLSYSIFNGTIRDNFRHPFHKKLGVTVGIQFKF